MSTFQHRYTKARRAKGWTNAEVARHAKCSRNALYKHKQMGTIPKSELLVKLARALDVTPEYLVGEPPVSDTPVIRSDDELLMERELVDQFHLLSPLEKQSVINYTKRLTKTESILL